MAYLSSSLHHLEGESVSSHKHTLTSPLHAHRWLSDKLRRDTVIRVGGAFGAVALVVSLAGLWLGEMLVLGSGIALWGVYQGFTGPAMEVGWHSVSSSHLQ